MNGGLRWGETALDQARREKAERERREGAERLRAYMRERAAATLARLAERITVVEGEGEDTTPSTCPTCGGLGVIRYDVPSGHPSWGKLFPCPDGCTTAQRDAARRADAILTQAGVPGTYRELTFESWVQLPDAARAGKELAAGACWIWSQALAVSLADAAAVYDHPDAARLSPVRKPWLVLQGDLGLGKTGLAAAATNALAVAGHAVTFYRLQEMFSEIQSRYGENETGRNADDIIGAIQRAAVLVLDECNVPGQRATDDKARLLEEIIRYRHARQLPMLLTLNADQRGFETQWGRRTADVVFASAHWIELTGQKLRRTDAAVKGF